MATYATHTMNFRGEPQAETFAELETYRVKCAINSTLSIGVYAACVVNEQTGKVVARYEHTYDDKKRHYVIRHKSGKRF